MFHELPELVKVKLRCDKHRFLQVLSNLLSNAIKFSPDQAEVLIECVLSGRSNQEIKLSITDHGPGISTDFHSRLFQKFSQADSSTVRKKSGTGLGLAISKELIEQMGGEIGFTSIEGKGSCFYITFPIIKS